MLYFQCDAVLVAAKALIGQRGITSTTGSAETVTHHHLMLARQHTLRAEGLAGETFAPKTMSLAALRPAP